ncbi:MAG: ATP-dependent zinc metalloprotease FtsH [Holosporales bacterium]|jgi:cell division protease FtsH|nr:ATP-dependent zinc metalloprotease FtsH [Holosporales bacterium]
MIWLAIFLGLAFVANFVQSGHTPTIPAVAYSDFLQEVDRGRVSEVLVRGPLVIGKTTEGHTFSTYTPRDPQLIQRLADRHVRIVAAPDEGENPTFLQVFLSWFPTLLFAGIWIFFWRRMQSGGNKAMGFGKSRAKVATEKPVKVTFADVAGIDEAKHELEEIVDFLKDPKKFQRLGGKIPRGVLLVGPPGTGKTLLARAIAGEANVPFFSISGSEFVEMFVGVGASRVRDMFSQGKRNAPCIIFIDEIDAVGRHRGFGLGGGNDEREQTLNQLLVEMDGFESNDGVIIIAATNRPDVLDQALLRPGRFDRQVTVPNPDLVGRDKILRVHLKKVPLSDDVDPMILARGTPGFSGADLANLVNEAALLAARREKRVVGLKELEEAKDKVLMGSERRSMAMTEKEKEVTAYHEAGHAIVALHSPETDPIHKATIIPRGRALGMVIRLPDRDSISLALVKLKSDLQAAMGGRIAEEMIFGPERITTGAASDIKSVTETARRMVTEWGMSSKLGFLSYEEDGSQSLFWGRGSSSTRQISEKTAAEIDTEVRHIVDTAYAKAQDILNEWKEELHILARGLLEYEMLSGEEIQTLLKGEPIVRSKEEELAEVRIPSLEPSETPGSSKARPRKRSTSAPAPSRRPKKKPT